MNAGAPLLASCAVTAANGAFVARVDRSLTQLIQPQLTTKQVATARPCANRRRWDVR